MDIIEQWHDRKWNQPAIHTGPSDEFGECTLSQSDMRASVLTSNCDNSFNSPPTQFEYQGCTVSDDAGPWGSADGSGVYAMEWTSEVLKLYSFTGGNVPTNIDSGSPDTGSWGKPMMMLKNENCDIDEHFARQKLVFNINFCGNPAGLETYWKDQTECAVNTGYDTCEEYVEKEGADFVGADYKIRDIRVFKEGGAEPTEDPEPTVSPTKDPESSASATKDPEPTQDPTGEPSKDPEPTADPTEDPTDGSTATGTETEAPQPTVCDSYECSEESSAVESGSPSSAESGSPQPTACDSYECSEESSTETSGPEPTEPCDDDEEEEPSSVESSSPQPTVCDSYECSEESSAVESGSPSSVESSSPQPTVCDSYECSEESSAIESGSPSSAESSSPQPTGCDSYECQESSAVESSGPEPTEPCDDEEEEEEPTSPCDAGNCPEVPTSIESESPKPTEDDYEEEPAPTKGPKPTESASPAPTGCAGGECPQEPEESSSPVPDEGCHGDECGYPEEPLESSSPVPGEGSYPETEVPEPECFGSGCPGGHGNGTDDASPVPTGPVQGGANVVGVSVGLAALVAVFAL
ncbi:hypothetical protein IMZ48_38555, partial [Candidatus Bathyarchaeota archaeon]|nr:hypothetical protein [Candidatus Bathyarchaeota archaeon]